MQKPVLICSADGFVYEGIDYGVRIEERLSAAGLRTARYDFREATVLDAARFGGFVLTGGATSVSADVPWMRAAIDSMAELVALPSTERGSVIGICLGSQILAEAIRKRSTVPSSAIEVGLSVVRSPASASGAGPAVPAFHYEQISPELAGVSGVSIEWGNDHSPVQGFAYGEGVRAYQFHPELRPADVHRLIDFNADTITMYGGSLDRAHDSVRENESRYSETFFDRIVIDELLRHL